ncbi:MAG: sigma-54-dependent transcriptional regulator [Myxococcota bacterium]
MEGLAILVVDDDESTRTSLLELLRRAGHPVRAASTVAQALEELGRGGIGVTLLGVELSGENGWELLRRCRETAGQVPVVVLEGKGSFGEGAKALQLGASEVLPRPVEAAELEGALQRALSRAVSVPGPVEPDRSLIFTSPAMRRSMALVERIADTDVPVLLLGESGTGKEVLAREVHAKSHRHAQPFIKVNCAALPAELLESELFGHEKGAFTGATAEKPGKFELADKGTIFLDEIGEMAIRLQAKLLQVLQDEEFFRVGGKKSVRVDARVVVATNRDLEKEIGAGNFREDLFYRLNVVAIRVAPLRERKEDIVPLVDHFLKKYGRRYRNGLSALPAEVLAAFQAYDWPGNVRELENMVRRLVVLKDPVLVLDELRGAAKGSSPPPEPLFESRHTNREPNATFDTPFGPQPTVLGALAGSEGPNRLLMQGRYANPFAVPQPPPPPPSVPEDEMSLKDIGKRAAMLAEREAILAMLQRTAWNKRKAASRLRISYKALLYKIKESGIIDPRSSADL